MAVYRSFALIRRIEASPAKAFAAFALLHAAVWTALPALLYPNLPLDLIEALVYGREWQLGYDKLPPLPWWLAEAAYRLIGHDFAYYLLAQITVVAALAAVFAMAWPLIGGVGALVAVLIIDGLHYLNYTADKFNHDVDQLPFWALAGLSLHRALRGGALRDWLLLGIAIGLSLWAKYFVLVLALPMLVFLIADRDARKAWATPGPYVALATALVVMAPHLVWLVRHDFLPLAYAEHRAVLPRGLLDHLWHPLQFALSQLYFLLPALLIAVPLFLPRTIHGRAAAANRRRRFRPPHRQLAGVRADGHGAGALRAQRPRHGRHVGLSDLALPRRLAGAGRATRARRGAAFRASSEPGRCVLRSGGGLHRQLLRCCPITTTATARCSFPATKWRANYPSAIAPSPGSRSFM